MISKKVGLAGSLMLIVGLQGCGGGGAGSETSAQSSVVSQTNNALNTLASETSEEVTKTVYTLKKKLEVFPEFNTTTTYNYTGDFIATSNSVSTNGVTIDKTYTYDTDTHTLDVKVKNFLNEMELTQRSKFETGASDKSVDLARNDSQVYLYSIFDPISYHDSVRIVKNMTDIDLGLYNVNEYAYTGTHMTTLSSGYQDSLASDFISEAQYIYSYDAGLKIDGVAVDFNHTFTYSDDNKTVIEFADGKMLRKYTFVVEGE